MDRRRLVVALVAAAGVGAVAQADAAPRRAPSFNRAVVVSSKDASEPGINVSPDGRTVYVDAPTGVPSGLNDPLNSKEAASYVFKSTDAGRSFTLLDPGLRATHLGGGDSDITVDAKTGTLSMTDLWLGSSTVSRSTDGGKTWLSNPVEGVVAHDRQWLAAATGQRVYHATHQIPSGLVVSMSADGGLTYPTHYLAATPADQTGCVCPPGALAVRAGKDALTDKIAVAYYTSTGGIKVARSVNSGVTFTNVAVYSGGSDTGGTFPVIASPGGDRLVAVWKDTQDGRTEIMFGSSNDWGASWSTPRVLVRAGTGAYPWIDARGGKVAVSLFHTTETDLAGADDSVRWYEKYLESLDGGRTWSALVTVDPVPVKRGIICLNGVACSSNRELGDFQSLALDSRGVAHLTYARSVDGRTDTEIRYARQR